VSEISVSASCATRDMLFMPLMKGSMRFSVRSDDMGDCRLEREMVRTGTWWARIGGGGGRVGKSLRLMVLESSAHSQHSVFVSIEQERTDGYHALSIIIQVL
jgi:hypothetical protein